MANVLLVGCGYVGAALAEELLQDGHRVVALTRSGGSRVRGVQHLQANVTERDSLLEIPDDIEVVFYTVAASEHTEEGYRQAYVEGLRNVLAVLREKTTPLRRLFFTSSTSVYGQENGEWVDEESETSPSAFSGRVMREAEELALHSSVPATVVRLSGIYGPGRTWMLEQVAAGAAPCYIGPPRYTNRIHRDDCAGVLHFLMNLESPADCYLASDDDPCDRTEFIFWLKAQLGAPEPEMRSLDHASQRMLANNKRCKNARLRDAGYAFRYPTYREGYQELCRQFRR